MNINRATLCSPRPTLFLHFAFVYSFFFLYPKLNWNLHLLSHLYEEAYVHSSTQILWNNIRKNIQLNKLETLSSALSKTLETDNDFHPKIPDWNVVRDCNTVFKTRLHSGLRNPHTDAFDQYEHAGIRLLVLQHF